MKYCSSLLYTSILLLLVTACSKDDTDTEQRPKNCRIASATRVFGPAPTEYLLTYDKTGRVTSISTTSAGSTVQKQFTFSGNVTKITHFEGGALTQIDSVVNNANGRMEYIRNTYPGSNIINESVYTYNGAEVATFRYIANGVPGDLYTASFSDGNLVAWTGGGTVQTYTYYANEAAQEGDEMYFLQLINYGNPYFRNKNLLKSVSVNNISQISTYTYDGEGKIISVRSENPSNVETITYGYKCE